MSTPDFLANLLRVICKFHDFTIQRHGGLPGFRDEGLLHLCVERPWMTAGGQPIYSSPFERATAIAEAIVRNHPFNDGNHRTALAAAHLVLGLDNMQLAATADEQRDNIRDLGDGSMSMQDFATWLERNCVLRTGPPV